MTSLHKHSELIRGSRPFSVNTWILSRDPQLGEKYKFLLEIPMGSLIFDLTDQLSI